MSHCDSSSHRNAQLLTKHTYGHGDAQSYRSLCGSHFFLESIVHSDSCTKTVLTQGEIVLRPLTRFATTILYSCAVARHNLTMDFSPTVLYSDIEAAKMHSCFMGTSVAKEMLQKTTFSHGDYPLWKVSCIPIGTLGQFSAHEKAALRQLSVCSTISLSFDD